MFFVPSSKSLIHINSFNPYNYNTLDLNLPEAGTRLSPFYR